MNYLIPGLPIRKQVLAASLVAFTLPFPLAINHLAIGIFLLTVLVRKQLKSYWKSPPVLAFILVALFAIHITGILYATHTHTALKDLEKNLAFFVFPLIFCFFSTDEKERKTILISFLTGVTLMSLIALASALYKSLSTYSLTVYNPDTMVIENYFRYHQLSLNINMHAGYFSMYVGFALLILLYLMVPNWQNVTLRAKRLFLMASGYYVLLIFLLNSINISFSVAVCIGLFFFSTIKVFYTPLRIYFIGLLGVSCVLLFLIGFSKLDFKTIGDYRFDQDPNLEWNPINVRMAKLVLGAEVLIENLPWGTGTGGTLDALLLKYKERHFELGLIHNFVPHNQLLSFGIEFGIIGIAYYFILFGWGVYSSAREKNQLLLSVFIIFLIFGQTESNLEVNKGIVFFCFFLSVLSQQQKPESAKVLSQG